VLQLRKLKNWKKQWCGSKWNRRVATNINLDQLSFQISYIHIASSFDFIWYWIVVLFSHINRVTFLPLFKIRRPRSNVKQITFQWFPLWTHHLPWITLTIHSSNNQYSYDCGAMVIDPWSPYETQSTYKDYHPDKNTCENDISPWRA